MVRLRDIRVFRVSGFTLVELMIVILVISIMSLVAAPLTMSWINSARLVRAAGIMEEATGVARANALRNAAGMTGNDTGVVAVCMSQQEISVLGAKDESTPSDCSSSTGVSIWNGSLPTGVTVTVNNQSLQCLCFNNDGNLIDVSGSCGGGCSADFEGKISAGSQTDGIVFH